jgi:hypothetical protein
MNGFSPARHRRDPPSNQPRDFPRSGAIRNGARDKDRAVPPFSPGIPQAWIQNFDPEDSLARKDGVQLAAEGFDLGKFRHRAFFTQQNGVQMDMRDRALRPLSTAFLVILIDGTNMSSGKETGKGMGNKSEVVILDCR